MSALWASEEMASADFGDARLDARAVLLVAPLARLEAQLVFATLRRRYPALRLGEAQIEHRNNFNLRGLQALPVVF